MKLTFEEEARRRICYVGFYRSLQVACDAAGGGYSWENIKHMTVDDLANRLCTNGIRFVYLPECSYGGDTDAHDFVRSGGYRWNGAVKIV